MKDQIDRMKQNKTMDEDHWSLGSDGENDSIEQPTIKKSGGLSDSSSIGSDGSGGRGASVHSPLRVLLFAHIFHSYYSICFVLQERY